jgi:hypothetical protein
MNLGRPSAARVAREYERRITYPRALPDRFYWGFESEDGELADNAAASLSRSVVQSTARLVTLGQKVKADIMTALEASGGVADAKVRAEVNNGVMQARAFATVEWTDIAKELMGYAEVDGEPKLARTACFYGLQDIYQQLAERANHPVMAELRVLYTKLADKVEDYFMHVK